MVILLDSPGFQCSAYCQEELNIANKERIPVLDVICGVRPSLEYAFCTPYEASDYNDVKRIDTHANEIVNLMEQNIAGAYSFKRKFIESEFLMYCQKFNIHPKLTQELYYQCDMTRQCFSLSTNIPCGNDYFKLAKFYDSHLFLKNYTRRIVYNGNYCMPDVKCKLAWFDHYLPINSFDINE
jgi:hypothetical protein